MAAATTVITAAALAASTATTVHKTVEAKKQAEKTRKDIEGYQREELRNVYAGIPLPMERARLQTEGVQQQVASSTEALSRAGARGVVGGLPQVQDFSSQALSEIGANIEESRARIYEMIAQDEKRIQGETARREEEDLAGLGALYEAGRQEQAAGMQVIPQIIGATGTLIGSLSKDKSNEEKDEALRSIYQDFYGINNKGD